jgi:hypothetical protein
MKFCLHNCYPPQMLWGISYRGHNTYLKMNFTRLITTVNLLTCITTNKLHSIIKLHGFIRSDYSLFSALHMHLQYENHMGRIHIGAKWNPYAFAIWLSGGKYHMSWAYSYHLSPIWAKYPHRRHMVSIRHCYWGP